MVTRVPSSEGSRGVGNWTHGTSGFVSICGNEDSIGPFREGTANKRGWTLMKRRSAGPVSIVFGTIGQLPAMPLWFFVGRT